MAETTDEPTPAAELDPMTTELADQGFAVVDGFPANHRLRAEALAAAGLTKDPAGHVTPELIAETGTRVAAENRDAKAETPSMSWNRPRLVAHAEGMGLTVETDANKATILAAITAATTAA